MDCYRAAGRYLIEQDDDTLILVHAEVQPLPPLPSFGHAWVENPNLGIAIDQSDGKNLRLSIGEYREHMQTGRFRNEHRYDYLTALTQMARTGIWGPWDLVTSSGL